MLDKFTGRRTWRPGRCAARLALALLLCCAALAGCGDSGRQAVKYYEIQSEAEEVFRGKAGGTFLGMQYYLGEAVQLWAEEGRKVYLLREDGSRELLMEVPGIAAMLCFLDGDGNCYAWRRYPDPEGGAPAVRKYDASGREACSAALPDGALPAGVCQLADGSIVLLLQSLDAQGRTASVLAELDPGKGTVSLADKVQLDSFYSYRCVAAGSAGVLVLEGGLTDGVREVGMGDGAVLWEQTFQGTGYSFSLGEPGGQGMQVQDFRMLGEDGMEVLWADPATGRGVRESLRRVETDRIPVVIRTNFLYGEEKVKEMVLQFNRTNDTYCAVLEYPGLTHDEQVACTARTSIEIGTGKGPDILTGYLLESLDEASLAEKGALEDLAPYMRRSRLREGDYFPGTFGCLRDGDRIYTANLDPQICYLWTDAAVLGGRGEPDVGELVDALAAWQGGGSYDEYPTASWSILRRFLAGSEDLWGMVDWEGGNCDFGGSLFREMLEVAKKYGEPASYAAARPTGIPLKPAEGLILGGDSYVRKMFDFESDAELRAEGKVRSGFLFDDGCHALFKGGMDNSTYAVNANSAVKEGAWEFIRFMLSEEVQRDEDRPVHRAIHMEKMSQEVQRLVDTARKYGMEDEKAFLPKGITEEWLEEYARTMDEARHLPVRTQALVDIICEEAEYYFDGVKSMDEVIKIIENRVGLYIGEHR